MNVTLFDTVLPARSPLPEAGRPWWADGSLALADVFAPCLDAASLGDEGHVLTGQGRRVRMCCAHSPRAGSASGLVLDPVVTPSPMSPTVSSWAPTASFPVTGREVTPRGAMHAMPLPRHAFPPLGRAGLGAASQGGWAAGPGSAAHPQAVARRGPAGPVAFFHRLPALCAGGRSFPNDREHSHGSCVIAWARSWLVRASLVETGQDRACRGRRVWALQGTHPPRVAPSLTSGAMRRGPILFGGSEHLHNQVCVRSRLGSASQGDAGHRSPRAAGTHTSGAGTRRVRLGTSSAVCAGSRSSSEDRMISTSARQVRASQASACHRVTWHDEGGGEARRLASLPAACRVFPRNGKHDNGLAPSTRRPSATQRSVGAGLAGTLPRWQRLPACYVGSGRLRTAAFRGESWPAYTRLGKARLGTAMQGRWVRTPPW